jgi:hypothetical protein
VAVSVILFADRFQDGISARPKPADPRNSECKNCHLQQDSVNFDCFADILHSKQVRSTLPGRTPR